MKLRYQITRSGVNQFFWYCVSCSRIVPVSPHSLYLSHSEVKTFRLPDEFWKKALLADNRATCQICGAIGAEVHHLAPQSLRDLFGDNWGRWPTIDACRDCHNLWHELTTPYMPGYNNSERAKGVLKRFGLLEAGTTGN